MSYHVTVTEADPDTVLELHRAIRTDCAGTEISAGMRDLYAQIHQAGLVASGPPSTTYLGTFGPGTTTQVSFGVPVAERPGALGEGVEVRKATPGLIARTTHRGDYHAIGGAYRALDDWIGSSRYRPIGPPTEVYLIGPDDSVDPHQLVTEIRVPVTAVYGLTIRVPAPFADTLARVRTALSEQGFGVLTEIDMRKTMQDKLGVTMEDYVILGACNPDLAQRAMDIDRAIGLLLPCNVVVRGDGANTLVAAADPDILMQVTEQPALRPIAAEARARLDAALQAVREL